MKKQLFLKILIAIFIALVLVSNFSFASYETVTMEVVSEPICKIDISNSSYFEKKLIEKDLTKKEVTLQLSVCNNEISDKPTGELVIVLDNSKSMNNNTSTGVIRANLVRSSAKSLISSLLKDNDQLKISIVSFSTVNTTTSGIEEGTINDAKLTHSLSNDAGSLNASIDSIVDDGARTNLEAGLTLGANQFTDALNSKHMIVLTDGVPNVAINYDNSYYSDDVINKTKTKLQAISNSGVNLITMLTGIDDPSYVAAPSDKTFQKIIQEIFGTPTAPISGTFYYIEDTDIEKTITEDIFNSLKPASKTLKNINVTDYFPKEIIDNFDFSYVSKASHGEISAEVNTTTNSITWNIPELKSGETATVKYVLSLKQNFDSSIVNKILNTNEKQDISYTDFDGEEQSKTSDISPTLKLTEPAAPTTPAPYILPKAGSPIIISTIALVGGISVFLLIRYLNIKGNIK